MKFETLGLIDPILKALKEKGYDTPTPIQAQAIPYLLKGRDILGVAQTGTGKTAAFAIPIIQHICGASEEQKNHREIMGLILTPTRELAIQIDDNIRSYAKHTMVRHTVIFGGVKQHQQVQKLRRGVDILVATPGRLLDLIQQGYIDLRAIRYFVLDEADRMLDMGFIHDIKKVLKRLPVRRQSLFFSATMPANIVKLSKEILDRPERVEVTPESTTAETLEQLIYYTNKASKRNLLLHVLKNPEIDQVLVFSRTKYGADKLVRFLKQKHIKAEAIHGDKAQNRRQKVLNQFKNGDLRVLVATDIASRGIDINQLEYVINYDIPNLPETYVHRIGRSGRAGKNGLAISISEAEENAYVKDIERLIGKSIPVADYNPFPQTDKAMTALEKKAWNKEKQRRKQEFFANRKKNRNAKMSKRSR